jgi:hypothetical protein
MIVQLTVVVKGDSRGRIRWEPRDSTKAAFSSRSLAIERTRLQPPPVGNVVLGV